MHMETKMDPSTTAIVDLRLEPPAAYIADTGIPEKGRGVFAARNFAAGELVEHCPVIVLDQGFHELPEALKTVVFAWGSLTGSGNAYALALGCGSIYNHGNPANMRYEVDAGSKTLKFIAARDVNKGEELTINYNTADGGPTSDNDKWFDEMGKKPVTRG